MSTEANNNQIGAAVSALIRLCKGTRPVQKVLLCIPTGKGKSRICAAIVSAVLEGSFEFTKIVVVYPSKILYDTDKDVLIKLKGLADFSKRTITYFVGLKNAIESLDKQTLLIIDECDYEILDMKVQLPKLKKHLKGVVGLSATLPQTDQYAKRMLEA